MARKYDFAGWGTFNDVVCLDGRVIREGAFAEQEGEEVPLVWNHDHEDMNMVVGSALLKNTPRGVRVFGRFNHTDNGRTAKELVQDGSVSHLSIYANQLEHSGNNVVHGSIKEVSLVLAGANPEARIDTIIAHSGMNYNGEEGEIYTTGEYDIELYHSDDLDDDYDEEDDDMGIDVQEQLDSLTPDQMAAVEAVVDEVIGGQEEYDPDDEYDEYDEDEYDPDEEYDNEYDDEDEYDEDLDDGDYDDEDEYDEDDEYYDEEDDTMKHNVFDIDMATGDYLSHADFEEIFEDAKRIGSLKEAYLQHSEALGLDGDDFLMHDDESAARYGIMPKMNGTTPVEGSLGIEALFPEYRSLNTPPEFIKRNMDWVSVVMNGVHHTPFSRIKSMFADITEDEARARGYMKGNKKVEEVFSLLKRTTDPQTIYKKQKLDRDDIIDITDFDVVAWIKAEMRMMLDEEIARAILVGDGRLNSSNDKIKEDHVRSIYHDDDFYSIKVAVSAPSGDDQTSADTRAKAAIRAIIKARKNYKGSGSPTFFTTSDVLTDMLLVEDGIGHRLYKTEAELATALRVSRIVEVEVMENQTRTTTIGTSQVTLPLMGIIVNLTDYNVGADKGGAVALFDDFDIDYNQFKYLIETRMSGALVKPKSAMVIELNPTAAAQG